MSNVYTRNRKPTLCSYSSYRGYILKDYNSHRTVRSMDKLFHELFGYDVQIAKTEVF
jgi:hypothetical protein